MSSPLAAREPAAAGAAVAHEPVGPGRSRAGADPGPHGTALRLRGVTVRYREVVALERVDLTLRRGEACGLVGMNGSGKSTLFRVATGLLRPTEGTVEVLGGSTGGSRRRGAVAYVPQHDDLDRDFPVSVRDVVTMGRYHRMGWRRRPTPGDRDAVEGAIARVGLTALAGRQIGRLSGGQRQRALLARALVQDAELLLLDEPFTGVDVASQAAVVAVLQDLVADGRTLLVSSHDLAVLPDLCATSVLLHRTVLAHGPTADVLTPQNLALTFGLAPAGHDAGAP